MTGTGKNNIDKKNNRAQASRPKGRRVKNRPKARIPTKAWSKAEDSALVQLIAAVPEEDTSKWNLIAGGIRGRSGKQCRERWSNHLRPGIKKGEWKVEEDRIIAAMQKEIGNKWTKIADHLPGRTDNDVKNRWYSFMRSLKKRGKNAGDILCELGREDPLMNTQSIATNTNAHHETTMSDTKSIVMENIIYKTPAKKLPTIPVTKSPSPALSLAMESFLDSSDSVLAASTLSAMKRGLFSPCSEKTKENQEPSLLVRRSGNEYAPPTSFLFHPSNAVRADDIFSPSYPDYIHRTMATPTPAMPLATISSCHSGPFFPNTPMSKEKTIEGSNDVTNGKSSQDGDSENNVSDVGTMTPLSYRYKTNLDFTMVSCPRKYHV